MRAEVMTDLVSNGNRDLKREKIHRRLLIGKRVLENECWPRWSNLNSQY